MGCSEKVDRLSTRLNGHIILKELVHQQGYLIGLLYLPRKTAANEDSMTTESVECKTGFTCDKGRQFGHQL